MTMPQLQRVLVLLIAFTALFMLGMAWDWLKKENDKINRKDDDQ